MKASIDPKADKTMEERIEQIKEIYCLIGQGYEIMENYKDFVKKSTQKNRRGSLGYLRYREKCRGANRNGGENSQSYGYETRREERDGVRMVRSANSGEDHKTAVSARGGFGSLFYF